VTAAAIADTIAAFHRMHERLYTFSQEDTPVEIVTLRVDAEGVFAPPRLPALAAGVPPHGAIVARQTMYLATGPVEAPVYDRARFGAGARLDGPAILTQLDATTLVLPGQVAEMDACGNLIVGECAG
jgi:N-methylhydantoinase A